MYFKSMKKLLFGVIAAFMVSGLLLGSMGSDVFALSAKGAEKGEARGCNDGEDDNPGKATNNPHCEVEPPCEEQFWYQDNDGDGYGAGNTVFACEAPPGYVAKPGDCNDNDADIYPGHGC
jgi:hypothetical protein